jgi:hypothetical protein
MWADPGEVRCEVLDELYARFTDRPFVAVLVGSEPLAIVVGFEVMKKREERG